MKNIGDYKCDELLQVNLTQKPRRSRFIFRHRTLRLIFPVPTDSDKRL